jgi:hypothetical protein
MNFSKLVLGLLAFALLSIGPSVGKAFADEDTAQLVPQACQAFVYAAVDRKLPKKQLVTGMEWNTEATPNTVIDIEITLIRKNENFCVKTGTVEVQYEPGWGGCKVLKINLEKKTEFDCG